MLLLEFGASGDFGLMANLSWDGEPTLDAATKNIELAVAEDRFLGLVDCGTE